MFNYAEIETRITKHARAVVERLMINGTSRDEAIMLGTGGARALSFTTIKMVMVHVSRSNESARPLFLANDSCASHPIIDHKPCCLDCALQLVPLPLVTTFALSAWPDPARLEGVKLVSSRRMVQCSHSVKVGNLGFGCQRGLLYICTSAVSTKIGLHPDG